MMIIDNNFDIKQIVYLNTDGEQLPRVIFCISIYEKNIVYGIRNANTESWHYEFELSKDKIPELSIS